MRNPLAERGERSGWLEQMQIDPLHPPDAKLVMVGAEVQRTQGRRIEMHITDRHAELLIGKRKVFPRLADEDAGGVDGSGQALLAVDQHDAQAARSEET